MIDIAALFLDSAYFRFRLREKEATKILLYTAPPSPVSTITGNFRFDVNTRLRCEITVMRLFHIFELPVSISFSQSAFARQNDYADDFRAMPFSQAFEARLAMLISYSPPRRQAFPAYDDIIDILDIMLPALLECLVTCVSMFSELHYFQPQLNICYRRSIPHFSY